MTESPFRENQTPGRITQLGWGRKKELSEEIAEVGNFCLWMGRIWNFVRIEFAFPTALRWCSARQPESCCRSGALTGEAWRPHCNNSIGCSTRSDASVPRLVNHAVRATARLTIWWQRVVSSFPLQPRTIRAPFFLSSRTNSVECTTEGKWCTVSSTGKKQLVKLIV